jgi:hypothetical protein
MQTTRNDSGFNMAEVWRKWFLLVGLAAGVLIGLNRPTWAMTFQSDIDALVRQSGFIFRGTVKKLNADTRHAEQNSSIVIMSAVVSVDEALQAPAAFAPHRGRTITLQLKAPSSVKMGQQLIFFTNVIRILSGAKGFVIYEVGRMEAPASSDTLRQQIAAARRRLADQELQQRLEINAQSTSTSSARPKLRIGYVKDQDVGCGSAFFLNTTDMENHRYIFSQDVDDPPYINLNGKNLQLRLTASNETKDKKKVGDRWWDTYAAGGVKVRIDYTVTRVCTPQDEMCETTYLNAIMTVSQKAQKTTVKLTGYSGC